MCVCAYEREEAYAKSREKYTRHVPPQFFLQETCCRAQRESVCLKSTRAKN